MLRLPTGAAVLALVIAVFPRVGKAEPPEGADPALRPWFESLKQPGTGVSCCSISDCRPVQYRLAPGAGTRRWSARCGSTCRMTRSCAIKKNPLGRAVLCRSPASGTIFCFVPGPET